MSGEQPGLSRRGFAQRLGQVAAASTLATLNAPAVHGAVGDTIQFALVGAGGRGTGAVVDAFATKNGPLKLVAMADIFEDKLTRSYKSLANRLGEGMAVKDEPWTSSSRATSSSWPRRRRSAGCTSSTRSRRA
jgi:hypothetical protein